MVKVYDMVTCSLYAPEEQLRDAIPDGATFRAFPSAPALALQQQEAHREAAGLHPALRHTDIETFIAAFDR